MRHIAEMILSAWIFGTTVAPARAGAETAAGPEADPMEEARRIRASHSHREGQWLLDFQPLGFTTDLNQGGPHSSVQVDYMLKRFLWLGVSGEWERVGFMIMDSDPPQYHHVKSKRFLARAGVGGSGRVAAAFAIIGFGANFTAEDVSNFETPESVWLSKGLSLVAGGELAFAVHPNLSIGMETRFCWDFQIWDEPYSDRLLSFVVAPMFRVHL